MDNIIKPKEFFIFVFKCMVIHALTYWILGIIFSNLFDYKKLFETEIIRDYMKSYDSGHLIYGALSQVIRGVLFGIVFWPFRAFLIGKKFGWLYMWGVLVIVGIINTPAASPSSIEGVLYTKVPLWYHFLGLPEVVIQTLLFSILLLKWDRKRMDVLNGVKQRPASKMLTTATYSLVIGSFGYMTYALTAIAGAFLSGVTIDFKAASADMSQQIVFVVAFVFNFGLSFAIGTMKEKIRIPIILLFIGFIALDIIVPYIYSWLFYGGPFEIWFALLLGIVPGAIVALSNYLLFYKNLKTG
jgi:hypothetical protein